MSQEKRRVHPHLFPEHEHFIVTSKTYSSIDKFIELAKESGNVVVEEGETLFKNPYGSKIRKGTEQAIKMINKLYPSNATVTPNEVTEAMEIDSQDSDHLKELQREVTDLTGMQKSLIAMIQNLQ